MVNPPERPATIEQTQPKYSTIRELDFTKTARSWLWVNVDDRTAAKLYLHSPDLRLERPPDLVPCLAGADQILYRGHWQLVLDLHNALAIIDGQALPETYPQDNPRFDLGEITFVSGTGHNGDLKLSSSVTEPVITLLQFNNDCDNYKLSAFYVDPETKEIGRYQFEKETGEQASHIIVDRRNFSGHPREGSYSEGKWLTAFYDGYQVFYSLWEGDRADHGFKEVKYWEKGSLSAGGLPFGLRGYISRFCTHREGCTSTYHLLLDEASQDAVLTPVGFLSVAKALGPIPIMELTFQDELYCGFGDVAGPSLSNVYSTAGEDVDTIVLADRNGRKYLVRAPEPEICLSVTE